MSVVERPLCECHGEPMNRGGRARWSCAIKAREYREANREKLRIAGRVSSHNYRAGNVEKIRKAARRYYAANHEKRHRYYAANAEKLRESARRKYAATHPKRKRKMDIHGTNACYKSGCKCDDCKRANTARMRAWKNRARASGGRVPKGKHGTQTGSVIYGCHCDECTAWLAQRNRLAVGRHKIREGVLAPADLDEFVKRGRRRITLPGDGV